LQQLTPREVRARETYWTGIGLLALTYTLAVTAVILAPSTPGTELSLMRNVQFAGALVVYGAVYLKVHGAALELIGESAKYSNDTNWFQEWLA